MSASVLVTGASSGLGLATAGALATHGWHVILGCRDPERGDAAVRTVHRQEPGASVEVLPLDLASLASVRTAAQTLTRGGDRPPLRALVGNAGIQVVTGVARTADGFEQTFGVNHLGHFLLTTLLRDQLAAPARIVMVGSGTHHGGLRAGGFPAPHWDDPHALLDPDRTARDTSPRGGASPRAGRVRYATSKLATCYFTYELARRLGDRPVTANVFDPGLMPETRLHRDYGPRAQRVYKALTPLLLRLPSVRSVATSAASLAWLVTAEETAGVTGGYFVGRRQRRSSPASYDRDQAVRLWEVSEELVAATWSDPDRHAST